MLSEPSKTTNTPSLSGKQRRFLRALGHHLSPCVQLGKNGLTDALTAAVDQALTDHELIKIKLSSECPEPTSSCAEALSTALGAHTAQCLGHTVLLYRRHPETPRIKLPSAR